MLLLFNLWFGMTGPVEPNQLLANTPSLNDYPPDEQTCIIYATEIRKKLVPPQYARSGHLYPKYAGLCTFNAAYEECMNKVEK